MGLNRLVTLGFVVFAVIILADMYFVYSSKKALAPPLENPVPHPSPVGDELKRLY